MKFNYNLIYFACLLFLVSLFSCEPDDPKPDPPKAKTKTELLTQNWKLIKLTANGSDQPTAGYTINFTSSKSYTAKGPLLSVQETGTWAFNSAESEVLLNGGPDKFLVNTLTDTKMILTINQTSYKAGAVSLKMEFGL
ncbi:hypothetical protein [Cyclobacterium qasimii]|uniref:Lipocalin-like domain-containing protein n=2 Tax=Cyclobacterium qasimii TaxID=1350429 RepID=S7WE38_9BACT|nr:hypothetical protein [Cyclobacterium qasimii]EPR65069.1 hypothetical protein ADICYQ_5998 [Cyclobacterium qasimii M12-11B]GEO20827.1 hypothetical protein CQA01_13610 [Cyclobacterium qasimii]